MSQLKTGRFFNERKTSTQDTETTQKKFSLRNKKLPALSLHGFRRGPPRATTTALPLDYAVS